MFSPTDLNDGGIPARYTHGPPHGLQRSFFCDDATAAAVFPNYKPDLVRSFFGHEVQYTFRPLPPSIADGAAHRVLESYDPAHQSGGHAAMVGLPESEFFVGGGDCSASLQNPETVAAVPRRRRPLKKDRHSKISTAQGMRDRRMRLSREVADEFFKLQDMLGYERGSKTVEWLFCKAGYAIEELYRGRPDGPGAPLSSHADAAKSSSSSSEYQLAASYTDSPPPARRAVNATAGGRYSSAASDLANTSRKSSMAMKRARAKERTKSRMRRSAGEEDGSLSGGTLSQINNNNNNSSAEVDQPVGADRNNAVSAADSVNVLGAAFQAPPAKFGFEQEPRPGDEDFSQLLAPHPGRFQCSGEFWEGVRTPGDALDEGKSTGPQDGITMVQTHDLMAMTMMMNGGANNGGQPQFPESRFWW